MTVKSEKPFDYSGQVWRGIDDKFPKKINNATSTSDGLMSAEDKEKLDSLDANDHNRIYDVASWESDGLMSKEDKMKMDGIDDNANNYIHPDNENIRHVTDAQITYWNAKASTNTATTSNNGLMSKEDKAKLDAIEENANNYVHPDNPSMRHVTDAEKALWNTKYVHPDNEGVRHVSDAEKKYWNSKADKTLVTNAENGLMPYIDKIKLDSIEPGANYYIHPEDENTRHVTDDQIKYWNSKSDDSNIGLVTHEKNGLMRKEDKIKLDQLVIPDIDELTLTVSEWSDTEPYTQTVYVPGLDPELNTYISINSTASIEEMICAAEAKLKVHKVEADKITIIATGAKPTMDIPIIIVAGSSIIIFEVVRSGNGSALDLAPILDRIKVLEEQQVTMTDKQTIMEGQLTSIEDNQTAITDKQTIMEGQLTSIEDNQTALTEKQTEMEVQQESMLGKLQRAIFIKDIQ